jgi:hypothetical protein
VLALGCAAIPSAPARAADKARLTDLQDVAFGTIAGTADQSASQSVCAYSSSSAGGYSVTATGDGSGGAFTLSSGAAQLPYEVLWAGSANQTTGLTLVAGATMPGFISGASQQTCNSGPAASASLTVVIRSSALVSATAGSYSGSLQITIAPE